MARSTFRNVLGTSTTLSFADDFVAERVSVSARVYELGRDGHHNGGHD